MLQESPESRLRSPAVPAGTGFPLLNRRVEVKMTEEAEPAAEETAPAVI